jgi:hypothetical protein
MAIPPPYAVSHPLSPDLLQFRHHHHRYGFMTSTLTTIASVSTSSGQTQYHHRHPPAGMLKAPPFNLSYDSTSIGLVWVASVPLLLWSTNLITTTATTITNPTTIVSRAMNILITYTSGLTIGCS